MVANPRLVVFDAVMEEELKENGFRRMRYTKLVFIISLPSFGFEQLEALAVGGMNITKRNA